MSEHAPDTAANREFPDDVRELHAEDGDTLYVSPWGGQVWADADGVIFPLDERHAIALDKRRINPNPPNVGETKAPGGTWLSFGRKGPVHGPYSSPSYLYAIDTEESTDSRLVMVGRADGRTEPFFDEGESFGVRRVVEARPGGSTSLRTTITNQSGRPVDMPEATEHLYLSGGPGSGIVNSEGTLTRPEDLPPPKIPTSNKIDTRISSALTGTPGEVAFMPEGENGRVVVVMAHAVREDGSRVAIDEFCVYRFNEEDPWTAIEPTLKDVTLGVGESITMDVEILTFANREAYQADRDARASREREQPAG